MHIHAQNVSIAVYVHHMWYICLCGGVAPTTIVHHYFSICGSAPTTILPIQYM